MNPTANVSYSYGAYYPRLVSMTDGIGTTSFSYGSVGADGALKLAAEVGPYSGNDTVTYSYDALGRVIERNTDQKDDLNYDALGRVVSESNPLGTFGNTYLGDTAQLSGQSLITPTHTSGYSVDADYDSNTADRQLKSLTYRGPFALLATESLGFTHSPEHQLLSRSEFSLALLHTHLNNYSYDKDYRLTQTTLDLLLPADQYSYDNADNLIQSQSNTGAKLTATANDLNQLGTVNGTTWQYDADGNLINDGTFQYAWDAANRLISVTRLSTGHVTSFKYDGLGRRLAIDEQDSGGTPTETRYLWCGNTLCGARDGSDSVTADYYRQGEVRDGTALYYVKDQIGSVMGVMNASGALLGTTEYSAYGATKLTTGIQSDFRYAGMLYNPATGLYLTKYREYSPAVGRWLNRDPIGELGGLNVYAYVGGNPVSLVDPNGTDPFIGATVGFVAGAFYGGYGAYLGGGSLGEIAVSTGLGGAFGAGIGALDPSLGVGTYAFVSGSSALVGDLAGQLISSDSNSLSVNVGELAGATLGGTIGGAGTGALLPAIEALGIPEVGGTVAISSLTAGPGALVTGAGQQIGNSCQ